MNDMLQLMLWILCVRIIMGEIELLPGVNIERSHGPGLFFERQKDLKIREMPWRVSIAVDCDIFSRNLSNLRKIFKGIENSCPWAYGNCENHTPRYQALSLKFEETFLELKEVKSVCKQSDSTLSDNTRRSYYSKTEMLRKYLSDMDSYIEPRLTILESTLSKINSLMPNEDERLDKYLIKVKNLQMSTDFEKYHHSLYKAFDIMENKLRHSIYMSKLMIKNINSVKENRLLESLLQRDQSEDIISAIERYAYPSQLTIGKNEADIELLNKIVQIKYGAWGKFFFVDLEFPLMKNETYEVYEIKSFAIPQYIYNTGPSQAYIEPHSRYLLTKDHYHHPLTEKDLKNCLEAKDYLNCPNKWFSLRQEPNCEYSLLADPKHVDFQICNIKYYNIFTPQTYKTEGEETWLYSVGPSENITIDCNKNGKVNIQLNGTGLIKFSIKCTIHFKEISIEMSPSQTHIHKKIIFPQVSLELRELTHIFDDDESRWIFKQFTNNQIVESFWRVEKYCTDSIFIRKKQTAFLIVIVILSSLLLLLSTGVGGILAFMYYFKTILDETPDEIELNIQGRIQPESTIEPIYDTPRRAVLKFR